MKVDGAFSIEIGFNSRLLVQELLLGGAAYKPIQFLDRTPVGKQLRFGFMLFVGMMPLLPEVAPWSIAL